MALFTRTIYFKHLHDGWSYANMALFFSHHQTNCRFCSKHNYRDRLIKVTN